MMLENNPAQKKQLGRPQIIREDMVKKTVKAQKRVRTERTDLTAKTKRLMFNGMVLIDDYPRKRRMY